MPHQHALAVPPLAGVHGAAPAGVAGAEGLQVSCVIRQGAALQETVELKNTLYTLYTINSTVYSVQRTL